MKKCPFCAVPIPINRSKAEIGAVQVSDKKKEIKTRTEEIQDEAIKCKHCNEFLEAPPSAKPKTPWYAKTSVLVFSFLALGPLALPLVWFHPFYSLRKKTLLTVVVLALTYALSVFFYRTAATLLSYYKEAGLF